VNPVRRQPFFIVPKITLGTVIEKVEGTDAAFCCAVAVAVRWIANDAGTADGPVPATVAQIAHRSGLSYNSAVKAIGILESIGVLTVERQTISGTKAHAPSAYTFPTIRATPLPTIRRTFPTATPQRRADRYKEGTKEQRESERAHTDAALSIPDQDRDGIAVELNTTPNAIADALRIFNQIKAAYPTDPRTIDAFKGWLRTAKAAKAALKPAPIPPQEAVSIPMPEAWRDGCCEEDGTDVFRQSVWTSILPEYQRRIAKRRAAARATA